VNRRDPPAADQEPAALEVTFLGTRDAARRPRANTSAQLVAAGAATTLVDAGFGAMRGLRRAGATVRALDGVLLTHWHPDHVAGLGAVLRARARAGAGPLPVFGPLPPAALGVLLRRYADFTVVDPGHEVAVRGLRARTFATQHRGPSVGWLLEHAGIRVGIAGDTRPTEAVIDAIAGADALVFEATFAAHHAARARRSGHSTAGDAGRIAARAGVGLLVLTHLSQRYPREDVRREAAAEHAEVLVAEDGDRLVVERRDDRPGPARATLVRAGAPAGAPPPAGR